MNYADIPLPFGEMHTENIGSTVLIRAAIVAQLAKPSISPLFHRQLYGLFKYQVLSWIGIVGGAITLFSNLTEIVHLADWARFLVDSWHNWTAAFWHMIGTFIGGSLKDYAPTLSCIVCFYAGAWHPVSIGKTKYSDK